jgi:hypothetical protein
MRRTIHLLAVAALIAGCGAREKGTAAAPDPPPSPAAKAQAQVVSMPPNTAATNLDFESGVNASGFPTGWGGGGLGYLFAVDSSNRHAGKGSFAMKWNLATAPDSNDWATLTQCITADAWKGKRVRLSGFLKTVGVDSGAGLWMRVDTAAQRSAAAFDNMLDRAVTGMSDWEDHSVVLDVDPKAIDVCFGVVMVGKGTVWADDLALKAVGKEVPVTETPAKPN